MRRPSSLSQTPLSSDTIPFIDTRISTDTDAKTKTNTKTKTTSTSTSTSTSTVAPSKRKPMSITQTYHLAHLARGKLSSEASRSEHRLNRLVGHANLLDGLMVDLHTAEVEQERWFNATVKKAPVQSSRSLSLSSSSEQDSRKIRWADELTVEEPGSDWLAEEAAHLYDSDGDEDEDEDDDDDLGIDPDSDTDFATALLVRVPSHSEDITASVVEVDAGAKDQEEREGGGEEEDADDEELSTLALHLSPSHTTAIPELESDDEDHEVDDDEGMPRSPELDTEMSMRKLRDEERRLIVTSSYYEKADEHEQRGLLDREGSLFLRGMVGAY